MKTSIRTALTMALIAATAVSAFPANAGEFWGHHRRPIVVERHSGGGDMLAAGVLGLAAGAIVAGIASRPQPVYRVPVHPEPVYREPVYREPGYFPPAPEYAPRHDTRYETYAGYEPWSREWYRYCSDRYRSFDARTGTFTGYDGQRHFCAAE